MKSNHFLTLNHQFQIDKSQSLGKGSTGEVYLGNSLTSNQPVAIKIVRLQTIDNEIAQYLLQMEKAALRTLIHQNVLRAFKILQSPTKCYIITEYCNGGTLKDLINQQGSLSETKSLEIIRGILNGYSCLVKNKILHRDLKPANIMLHNQTPKIIDFGYCQIHGHPKPSLQYNVGSPSYMAPESFEKSIYNQKTQIWAIGIILYECIMGKTFDDGKQMSGVFKRIKQYGIPFRKQVSKRCRDIISWCLEFNPQNRPSASQLLHYISSNNNEKQYLERTKINSLLEISNLYCSGQLNRKVLESGRNMRKVDFDKQHKLTLKKQKSKQFGILTRKISTMKEIEDSQNQNQNQIQTQTQNSNYQTTQHQYRLNNYHPYKTQKHIPGQIVKNKHTHTHQLSSFGSLSPNSRDSFGDSFRDSFGDSFRDSFEQPHQQFKYGRKMERNPECQKRRTFIKPSMSPRMENRKNQRLATDYCATIIHQDVNMKLKDKLSHNSNNKSPLQKLIEELQLQRKRNTEQKDLWLGHGPNTFYSDRQGPSSSVGQLNQYLKNAKKPISIFEQMRHRNFR